MLSVGSGYGIAREATSAVFLAASTGEEEDLGTLIAAGAPVNRKDENGMSPLHWACSRGHIGCVQILLSAKADLFCVTNIGKKTPLQCSRDYKAAMRLSEFDPEAKIVTMMENAVPPETQNPSASLSLIYAVRDGDVSEVNRLLSAGASVNHQDDNGNTCMILCEWSSFHKDCIETILEWRGIRAACGFHMSEEDSRMHKIDLDIPNKFCWNALHAACFWGLEEYAKILIEHGASLTSLNDTGQFPYLIAEKRGHSKLAHVIKNTMCEEDFNFISDVTKLFNFMDEDNSYTLDKEELMKAVQGDCHVMGFIRNCESLKPLIFTHYWKEVSLFIL